MREVQWTGHSERMRLKRSWGGPSTHSSRSPTRTWSREIFSFTATRASLSWSRTTLARALLLTAVATAALFPAGVGARPPAHAAVDDTWGSNATAYRGQNG